MPCLPGNQNEYSDQSPIPFKGHTCIGIVGIKGPVPPGVKESVAICRSPGGVVRIVIGDNLTTAKAIAKECGILTDDGIAIGGPEFPEKSEMELQELIPHIQVHLILVLSMNLVRVYSVDDILKFYKVQPTFHQKILTSSNGILSLYSSMK